METEKSTENVWKAEQKNKENVENQAYQISQERALEMLEELMKDHWMHQLPMKMENMCLWYIRTIPL